MNFKIIFIGLCACVFSHAQAAEIWKLNSLEKTNGHPISVMGEPKIVPNIYGKALSFDGDGDRILVDRNPLSGAKEFTIEVIFKPNDVFPNNPEPRIFHIESPDMPNRRVTIELRLNDKHQWYLDAFIKSDNSQFTLIDANKVHPVDEWAHAAITYKKGEFSSYVNGEQELTGTVEYLPIPKNAKTSVGSRMNQIHWFNGEVLQVSISKKLLKPKEFKILKQLNK